MSDEHFYCAVLWGWHVYMHVVYAMCAHMTTENMFSAALLAVFGIVELQHPRSCQAPGFNTNIYTQLHICSIYSLKYISPYISMQIISLYI